MDPALKDKLVEMFGEVAVSIAAELDPIYGPAIGRMAIKEFLALDKYLNAKEYAAAKKLIRDKMTIEESADEKEKLTDLTFEMAESNGKGWNLAGTLLNVGARVLIAMSLGLVGL